MPPNLSTISAQHLHIMFWRFGGYANISTLDSILDKPDVTVEELLEESDLIQELKQQNSKLIEFLRGDAVVRDLVNIRSCARASRRASEVLGVHQATCTARPGTSWIFHESQRGATRSEDGRDAGVYQVRGQRCSRYASTCRLSRGHGSAAEND